MKFGGCGGHLFRLATCSSVRGQIHRAHGDCSVASDAGDALAGLAHNGGQLVSGVGV
jgi:hypothetical protein